MGGGELALIGGREVMRQRVICHRQQRGMGAARRSEKRSFAVFLGGNEEVIVRYKYDGKGGGGKGLTKVACIPTSIYLFIVYNF